MSDPEHSLVGPAVAPLRLARRSIADEVAASLRQRILAGDLGEGQQLRQDALAQDYGVSRIPVREALQRLAAEGLVVIKAHKGACVSGLAPEEIAELYELRACLEGDLAGRAMTRLTPRHLASMRGALGVYEKALARGRIADWGTENWRFHSALLEAAGRPVWLAELRQLNDRTERYVRLQLALTGALEQALADHRAIQAAAAEGDAEEVAGLMRSHIEDAGAALVAALRRQREEQP